MVGFVERNEKRVVFEVRERLKVLLQVGVNASDFDNARLSFFLKERLACDGDDDLVAVFENRNLLRVVPGVADDDFLKVERRVYNQVVFYERKSHL